MSLIILFFKPIYSSLFLKKANIIKQEINKLNMPYTTIPKNSFLIYKFEQEIHDNVQVATVKHESFKTYIACGMIDSFKYPR